MGIWPFNDDFDWRGGERRHGEYQPPEGNPDLINRYRDEATKFAVVFTILGYLASAPLNVSLTRRLAALGFIPFAGLALGYFLYITGNWLINVSTWLNDTITS